MVPPKVRLREAGLAAYLTGNGKGWGRTWEGDKKLKELADVEA